MSDRSNQARRHAMTNTHLLVHTFDYYEPATLEQAVSLLARHGDRAQMMAGGTNLVVWMKMEQMAPQVIININGLPSLVGITLPGAAGESGVTEESLRIGALTRIWDLRNSPALRTHYTALAEACASFGSTQIQLTGTIGGNICNGSPASDTVPALVALGAELTLVGPGGERVLPLEAFLVGPGEVALQDGEMLTAIRIPRPQPGAASAYVKISRVRSDLAKASAAATIVRDGDTITNCRLAFGSVAPTVMRCPAAERTLTGKRLTHELALEAGEAASQAVAPIDDKRSTASYRRQVVKALAHDAVEAAWKRAGEREHGGATPCPPPWGGGRGGASAPVPVTEAAIRQAIHIPRLSDHDVDLTVNGVHHHLSVRSNELLLNTLRERLYLTGTKYGCGIGECGACTVHLDGVPTLACLTLAVAVDGREVTTVEGLQTSNGELDPVQEAFIEHAAFQCGYCTPGMLMMTKRLLEEMPSASEDDIRDYLKGNRCRCTGFAAIVRAVESCVASE